MTPAPSPERPGWTTGRWLGAVSLIVGLPLLPMVLEGTGHRVYPATGLEALVFGVAIAATLTAVGSLFHIMSTLRGLRDVPLFLGLLVFLLVATPLVGLNVLKSWLNRDAPTQVDDT